uniref:Uncharacterized protein n=1 Tax=Erwinia amylovora ATCC BAA-2158 TaxID=889211 RepID=E5B6C5_ERWAM|nr:hypothetical protein predicted by Glimmer/Critica [Erwinia amylovora ATCC BAA-2158]
MTSLLNPLVALARIISSPKRVLTLFFTLFRLVRIEQR